LRTKKTKINRKFRPIIENIAHHFEILQGAIYSPDYLLPNSTQESKISWVGFLDENIINRLKKFLNTAKKIRYKGKIVNTQYVMKSTNIVVIEKYTESASSLPFLDFFEKYNCLMWAKGILGATIDCDLNRPSNCSSISQNDFNNLYDNLNNPPELVKVVNKIKNRWCIEPACTISGGKTRKKNRKNNKKNNKKTYRGKRKNKSRR
jgi:hypothetical protein